MSQKKVQKVNETRRQLRQNKKGKGRAREIILKEHVHVSLEKLLINQQLCFTT